MDDTQPPAPGREKHPMRNAHSTSAMNTTELSPVDDVVTRLREDVNQISYLRGQALSRVAGTLDGLKASLENYENHRAKAWQHYIKEQSHGK
jgi:hypothetical protein